MKIHFSGESLCCAVLTPSLYCPGFSRVNKLLQQLCSTEKTLAFRAPRLKSKFEIFSMIDWLRKSN